MENREAVLSSLQGREALIEELHAVLSEGCCFDLPVRQKQLWFVLREEAKAIISAG